MKTGTVCQLLEWAFGEELGKGGGEDGIHGYASAWGRIAGLVQLGTLVDCMPGGRERMAFHDNSEPHPAALLIGEAVAGLRHATLLPNPDFEGFLLHWPDEARALLPPFEAQIMRQVAGWAPRRQAAHLLSLVITSAVLRRGPQIIGDDPALRLVTGARGAPRWFVARSSTCRLTGRVVTLEADGYDARRGRPLPGAYRKQELKHSPLPAMWGEVDRWLLRQAWQHVGHALDRKALAAHGVRVRDELPAVLRIAAKAAPVRVEMRVAGAGGGSGPAPGGPAKKLFPAAKT